MRIFAAILLATVVRASSSSTITNPNPLTSTRESELGCWTELAGDPCFDLKSEGRKVGDVCLHVSNEQSTTFLLVTYDVSSSAGLYLKGVHAWAGVEVKNVPTRSMNGIPDYKEFPSNAKFTRPNARPAKHTLAIDVKNSCVTKLDLMARASIGAKRKHTIVAWSGGQQFGKHSEVSYSPVDSIACACPSVGAPIEPPVIVVDDVPPTTSLPSDVIEDATTTEVLEDTDTEAPIETGGPLVYYATPETDSASKTSTSEDEELAESVSTTAAAATPSTAITDQTANDTDTEAPIKTGGPLVYYALPETSDPLPTEEDSLAESVSTTYAAPTASTATSVASQTGTDTEVPIKTGGPLVYYTSETSDPHVHPRVPEDIPTEESLAESASTTATAATASATESLTEQAPIKTGGPLIHYATSATVVPANLRGTIPVESNSAEQIAQNDKGQCTRAFALCKSTAEQPVCFGEISNKFKKLNHWGWTQAVTGFDIVCDLWVNAVNCDTSMGSKVGTASMSKKSLEIDMHEGYKAANVQLYRGAKELPTDDRGLPTVNPEYYGVDIPAGDTSKWKIEKKYNDDFDGEGWIILHVSVCKP